MRPALPRDAGRETRDERRETRGGNREGVRKDPKDAGRETRDERRETRDERRKSGRREERSERRRARDERRASPRGERRKKSKTPSIVYPATSSRRILKAGREVGGALGVDFIDDGQELFGNLSAHGSSSGGGPFWRRWRRWKGSRLPELCDEPRFDLLARPRGLAQEGQAGLHRRIELEAADRDPQGHLAPAMPLDQLVDDAFQGDAVQRIAWM